MPDDLIGMFEMVESTATQDDAVPDVRENRLQLVRSTPASVWPYERKLGGYSFTSVSRPTSPKPSQRVLPARPRLVVIWMTPFDAAVPYSAAAAGPFTTSMLSISSGLMSLIRDGNWPPTSIGEDSGVLSSRTPSTMISGSLEREMELEPRMRTRVPAPLSPADVCTTTPGARELSASEKVLTAAVVICDASIMAVDAPFSRRRSVWPVAVTTT